MQLIKKVLVSGILLAAIGAAGISSATISAQSTAQDVLAGLQSNRDLKQVPAWFKAGVSESILIAGVGKFGGKDAVLSVICPLVKVGADSKRVTSAAILAGATPSKVVDEAACDGASRNDLVAAAIEAGADPAELTDSTGAGPQSPATPITPTPPGGTGRRASPS